MSKAKDFELKVLGKVVHEKDGVFLRIEPAYSPALKELHQFSHVLVLWWFHRFDGDNYRNALETEPPYTDRKLGIFATRSPVRPNPIALSPAKVLSVDYEKGVVKINNLDALDGSPIVDIKPYFGCLDRVRESKEPSYAKQWGEWYPEEGLDVREC